jgi:small-conductance mechanosensitive channel
MSGDDLSRVLTAVGTLVLVFVVVFLVDQAFKRRGRRMAERVTGGRIDPTLQTRLRFVRRVVEAGIIVIGVATALSQFTALDRFAASVLASSAIAAAVIGFAAQQSLGNIIAGVVLAITQPIRIGDQIAFGEYEGVVEDMRLSHTILETGPNVRVIVPNGVLSQSVVRNDSIVTSTVGVETELWLSPDSDELRALEVIGTAVQDATPAIREVTTEGTRLTVSAPAALPSERAARETELLRASLQALRTAGLR